MLFAEAMCSANVRSSLEVMLDTIRRDDEQPKGLPPALPTRPTSKGRLPSSRRTFPVNFAHKSIEHKMHLSLSERIVDLTKEEGDKTDEAFGWAEKAPDGGMAVRERVEENSESNDSADHKCTSSSLAFNPAGQFKSGEAIDYFLKKEYSRDGVEWRSIDYADNIDCFNLFEKPNGILPLLAEESASSKAIDFTLLNKLKLQIHGDPCFKGEISSFRICHYAGEDQLFELIQKLENTTPHFIRCINPSGKQLAGIFDDDLVSRQLRSFGILEIARIARSGYPKKMTHQQFVGRYYFLLTENALGLDPLGALATVLRRFSVLPCMYQVGYTNIFLRTGQLAMLESARARTLQGIVYVQKCFRRAQARRLFNDTKNGVTALQSFIRAERTRNEFHYLARRHRAAVLIQKHFKRRIAKKLFADQLMRLMYLQSVIRGQLARKHFNLTRNTRMMKFNHLNLRSDQCKNLGEQKDTRQDHPPAQSSDMAELQYRVLKAETELRHKEEENSFLRQQIQQYDMKWSDYETKMKSLEQMWQKQFTSLQMSLATAKRNLATDDAVSIPGRHDASPTYPYFDSEDAMSVETYTTEGTPAKQSRTSGINRTPDGMRNTISHLVKEFEERRQIFEDDAGFLIQVKSGLSNCNINPDEELRKLKVQFASWKKNYKVRLRETKTALRKLGNSTKSRWKWWGNWSLK